MIFSTIIYEPSILLKDMSTEQILKTSIIGSYFLKKWRRNEAQKRLKLNDSR